MMLLEYKCVPCYNTQIHLDMMWGYQVRLFNVNCNSYFGSVFGTYLCANQALYILMQTPSFLSTMIGCWTDVSCKIKPLLFMFVNNSRFVSTTEKPQIASGKSRMAHNVFVGRGIDLFDTNSSRGKLSMPGCFYFPWHWPSICSSSVFLAVEQCTINPG